MLNNQTPVQENVFQNERQVNDIDLISEVRNLLMSSGLQQEVLSNYDNVAYIKEATIMRPDGQRFLLNRFWNLQLLAIDPVTIEERFCLITNGEHCDWLRLFKEKILPCAITNRLPVSLNQF